MHAPDSSDDERRRWEQLRRAMLQVVAQFQEPQGRYTLDIRVAPKDRTPRTIA